MRSIDYLAKLYPDKTGKELFEIQNQDKLDDEKAYKKLNRKKLALIKDYNQNGAYFKSTFGLDQYRYDRFFDFSLDSRDNIVCSVETIVGFFKGSTTPNNELHIERKLKSNESFDRYMPQKESRITKEEYDLLSNHLTSIFSDFWGLIDHSKFR